MLRSAAASVVLSSALVWAAPSQCLGTGHELVIVDETLVGSLGPDGFENQVHATRCAPLIRRDGILFDFSAWDVGVFNYVSPIYIHQGVTVGVVPLSFIELRVDASGLVMWPLPLEGAGYYAFDGYVTRFTDADLPADRARSARGVNVSFLARLQGEVPLFGNSLAFSDTALAEWWLVGDAPYYVNMRRDVVLARSDWVVKNIAHLVFRLPFTDTISATLGAQDDLTYVPASRYVANILGAYFSLPIRREGTLRDIEPFVRLGAFTQHGWRTGFQLFCGVSFAWGL